jgi:undecaprenyl pyrophosphate phosphatase UppP
MNKKLEELKTKLKWLKVLLAVIPIIFFTIIGFIRNASKRLKIIMIVSAIIIVGIYLFVISEFFETKREIQRFKSIELIVEPPK